MSTPPPHLEFEATPLGGGVPGDPVRVATAQAVHPAAELREAFIAHGAATANLDRLFAGALCLTSGQQPGLLTGPLYTIHKALTAIALARDWAARLGRAVVPVFWVAGDDHDFAEANHTHVLGVSNDITRLGLRDRDAQAPLTPLYREPVGAEISGVFQALEAALPETEFRAAALGWLTRHYRPEANLAEAFGGALAELLGPHGLVVLQPTHLAAKRLMAPWLLRALEQAKPLNDALAARATELRATGHEVPVPVGDSATMVMVEGLVGRDRLLLEDGRFVARRAGQRWTLAELERLARDDPQRLSPNVLARPVIEAALLPTIGYVAGPGEMAYLPQCAPIYRALGVAAQGAVPRWSGRIVEARVRKVLEKYRITPEALNQPEGKLEASLVAGELPQEARDAVAALHASLDAEYQRLGEVAVAIDPTLKKPVDSAKHSARASLAEIEKRLVAHLKKQNETLVQQLDKARRSLFPLGQPQERVFNVTPYLVRYGPAVIDRTLAACAAHAATLETPHDRA